MEVLLVMPPGPSGERTWLALLPPLLLPLTWLLPAHLQFAARVLLVVATFLIWVTMEAGPLNGAPPRPGQKIGAWELTLLVFVLGAAGVYLRMALGPIELAFNDGAYYYGVARHMARTGRFEEPIVWHFLYQPATVPHTPFDYWGCLTSLLLLPLMLIFGPTLRTAFVTMGVLASLSLLALWYLVCVALPLRYRASQALAVVTFAFSPALDVYRLQPESIPVVHVFVLAALIAFCRGRTILAVLCGFCILLARGDGLILFLMIVLASIVRERRTHGHFYRSVIAATTCVAVYVSWSLLSFGTFTPPAPQLLPFMPTYNVVFDFDVPHTRSWEQLLGWFSWSYAWSRFELALSALRAIPFVPVLDLWLALAVVPLLRPLQLDAARALILVLCFGGYLCVAWISGPGFAPGRTPYSYAPLVVLTGALGVDAILGWLDGASAATGVRWKIALSDVVALALTLVFLARLPVLQTPRRMSNFPNQQSLIALETTLGGEPVATNVPWYMIAYTSSPAISIPYNGEAAIERALMQYNIRWLVLYNGPFLWNRSRADLFGASRSIFYELIDGTRTRIGRYELHSTPVWGIKHAVFRLVPSSEQQPAAMF